MKKVDRVTVPPQLGSTALRRELREACSCLNAGAARAAAVMLRRALERLCLDLGADEDLNLHDKIDHLSKAGALSKRWANVAMDLKVFGNDGAHIVAKTYDEITLAAAEEAFDVAVYLAKNS
ncbi:MAG: DUF4145 domain-containing protein [Myxococcota bacterium]